MTAAGVTAARAADCAVAVGAMRAHGLRWLRFHAASTSPAPARLASNSHVLSSVGQLSHLTKNSVPFRVRRCATMASTS